MDYESLTPTQKAAVALVAFGAEVSALVLKGLDEKELESITVAIANLRDVPPEIEDRVIEECHEIFMARQYISQGGVDYAQSILEKAVGTSKAKVIMQRLESSFKSSGFSLLKDIDPKQLSSFLQNEHPQTIALILTQLNPQIAVMEKIAPEILTEIEQTLEGHFERTAGGEMSASGGAKAIAEVLNLIDQSAEKNILQSLEAEDPDLAAEIKNMRFVFDDLILLDDRSIQRLLKEVETKDVAISLKAANDEVKTKLFANVSDRVKVMIEEEMEFMGPTRLSDVEAAQSRIVEIVRRLEEEGQVIISGRGGKEEIIV